MHSLHEALVNKYFLGYCCMSYSIEESKNRIVEGNDNKMTVEYTSRRVHLYDFIRAGNELHKAKTFCVQKHERITEDIHRALTAGTEYPWYRVCYFLMQNEVFTNFDIQAATYGAGTSEILFRRC